MSGKVSLGSVLSLTYSQFVSDRLTMGLEAGYNPLHQGLSYSVGAKYGDGAGFLGSEEGGVTCRRHRVVDEADGGLVHEEGLEENTTRLETRCGLQQPQVGCLYTFKSGKMYMTLTSSGHLQSFIVGDGRGGDL